MEPNEELLPQELAEEKAGQSRIRTEVIIGALVLIILMLCGVIWYIVGRPTTLSNTPVASSTPQAQTTNTNAALTLNEDAAYYTITASYPSSAGLTATAGAQANAKAVEVMKQFELNTIAAFKEQGNFNNLTANDIKMMGLGARKELLDIGYNKKSGTHTISYVYNMSQDTLGAHPNAFYRTFTFNTKTGSGLELGDLFTPGSDYLGTLSTLSRKMLPSIITKSGGGASQVDTKMIQAGTTADADNFLSWYIDGTNLVIIFPPYQVAPYAAGTQMLTIPFSQLSSILSSSYK